MLEHTDKKIGERWFRITQLPFRKSRRLLVTLTKTFGPALAALFMDSTKTVTGRSLKESVQALVMDVSDTTLDEITKALLEGAHYSEDGQRWPVLDGAAMERIFKGGNMLDYFEWLYFGIEVNYADFFDFGRKMKKEESTAPTSSAPVGSSPNTSSVARTG